MITAVDSNILFDVLLDDPRFAESSAEALATAVQAGGAVVCPVVYAELSGQFERTVDLGSFLRDIGLQMSEFGVVALEEAGRAWRAYRLRRNEQVQCPSCGQQFEVACPNCGKAVSWRQHLVADFLIGGHAQTQATALLTRDRGYYRTYFPQLQIVEPVPE